MEPRSQLEGKVLHRLLGDGPTRRARLDLLVFWAHFPGGWSTRAAIRPRTRLARRDIDQALAELVESGIARVHDEPGGPYYSLMSSPQLLDAVKQLGLLTPNERRAVLGDASSGGAPARVRDGARVPPKGVAEA